MNTNLHYLTFLTSLGTFILVIVLGFLVFASPEACAEHIEFSDDFDQHDVWRDAATDRAIRTSDTYRDYQNREDTRDNPNSAYLIRRECVRLRSYGLGDNPICDSYLGEKVKP